MFYRRVTVEQGGLGRFGHLRNAIDMLYNEPRRQLALRRETNYDVRKDDLLIWNDWSDLMIQTFCDYQWVSVAGCNSCVSGDTNIPNPITGEEPTIAELCERQEAPIVGTLYGPIRAGIPFIKGRADLFEVRLADGGKFVATAEHRVLCANGYCRVADLVSGSQIFSVSPSLQESILDTALSSHKQDEICSQKKAANSQADYPHAYRYDDGKLLLVKADGQSFAPSQDDAPRCSHFCLHPDDLYEEVSHSHPTLRCGLLSSFHASPRALQSGVLFPLHVHRETSGHAFDSPLSLGQFQSPKFQPAPFSKQAPGFSPLHSDASCSCPKVHQTTVLSRIRTGHDTFYDLGVPFAHHYFAGGAIHHNSWKSYCSAMYGLMSFFASPTNTVVVMTSTSLPGLRRRIWKEVMRFHRICPAFGLPVASDFCIRFTKGSDDAGIFGVATGTDNDIEKAVEKIIGFHATNVIAIVDEGQATNEALIKAAISLESGAEHFQFIILGNADSELDPHGRLSEPAAGWDSVTADDDFWLTERGAAVHLDCYDCPRVKEGDEFYPGLLRQINIDTAIKNEGEDSPYFWQYRRGFWAPQGVTKTVLSPVDSKRFRCADPVIWVGKFTVGATLDPAYEGDDRCVLRQHFCGLADIDGEEIVVLMHGEIVIIKLQASKSKDPIHYQIARSTVEHCERWGVPDSMFAIDSTGEGEGPAGVLVKEHGWHGIMRVDFNGRPSTEAISDSNRKPANLMWDRRVTELWFRYRNRVRNGQVRGLDAATLLEFCQRNYEDRGNGILSLETKRDMKVRTRRSPDLADNAVLSEELFRKRGVMRDPERDDDLPDTNERWRKLAKKYDVRNEEIMEV